MSTINGMGTINYGWKVRFDGDVEVTRWCVFAFFPIIPLSRHRARVHDAGESKGFFSLSSSKAKEPDLEIVESLPIEPKEVAVTYFKGWVVTPILLLLPPLLFIGISKVFNGPGQPGKGPIVIDPAIGGFGLIFYWAVVVSLILDLASGRRAARRAMEFSTIEAEIVEESEEP